jgi:two-component system, sensor histidine kinase and response regulator
LAYKILVIEDEEPVRQNLAELLEAEGYECVEAKDGEEGVRSALDEIPDLIICDVLMPKLDGFGVLARLSQDQATAAIPFVYLTARVERDDFRTGMEMGADDYVTKPFSRTDILNAIEKRLEKRAEVINQTRRAVQVLHDQLAYRLPGLLLSPMSVIFQSTESLLQKADIREDPAQVQHLADSIHRAAVRLSEAIANTMFYVDLELFQAEPDRKRELGELDSIRAGWEIKAISRIVARKHGRENDLFVDTNDAYLKICAEHFHKLIEAILDNAFEHSTFGAPVHVTGRLKEPGRYILRIHDAGEGMYPEQVANLTHMTTFDRLRFVKTHTGLGWMIARKIVDLCGGNVSIQSRLGEGTLVELELPAEGS